MSALKPSDLYWRWCLTLKTKGYQCLSDSWDHLEAMYEDLHSFHFESFMSNAKMFSMKRDGKEAVIYQKMQTDPYIDEGEVSYWVINGDQRDCHYKGKSLKEVVYRVPHA